MLEITVPASESWDQVNEVFINTKETVLTLEHSLLSVSKWESKWKICFLEEKNKTSEMIMDYIKCMTINKVTDPNVYYAIPPSDISRIISYIEDPMTATTFYKKNKKNGPHKQVTSERIYFFMTTFGIPFECEKWHLNRLMTLVQICSEENAPKEKMSKQELFARNARLNAERRAKYHTKG